MDATPPVQANLSPYLKRTSKELRRDATLAPGGEHFDAIISTQLPLVYGTALKLLPEAPEAAARVSLAAFELLAGKWSRMVKTRGGVITRISHFLLRAAYSSSLRERKRLRLPKPAKGSELHAYLQLFRRYFRLNRKTQWCVLTYHILNLQEAADSRRMRGFSKRADKGLRVLQKKLRKSALGADVRAAMTSIPTPAPVELQGSIIDSMRRWTVTAPRSPLTNSTILHWRLQAIGGFIKRVLAGLGATACVLGVLAGTFAYLATHGYLNFFFFSLGARDTLKKYPELAQPAKHWPATAEDFARVSTNLPANSAELYGQTNIWVAKLSFSEKGWKEVQPSRVEPVRDLFNGGNVVLRNPKAKRSGLAGAVGIDFNWAEAQFEFAGVRFTNVAARFRGNGTFLNSYWGDKRSFKVDLNKFTKKQKLAGVDELNFVNSIIDFSHMHDSLAQRLFRDLGVIAPRTSYAYLYLDAAGKFTNQPIGLYNLIENIDDDFAEDRFGTKKVPIFKPVTYELFHYWGDDWNAYAEIYDLKTEATAEQLQRVIDFARIVTDASDEEFARRVAEFLDIEEFAAYVAATVLLSSYDGFFTNGQNYFMYLDPRSNRFGFVSWDQDHSWGEFGYVGSAEDREQASIWKPWVVGYDFRLLRRTMETPVFREAYRKKLEYALEHVFTEERLSAMIREQSDIIRPAVAAENPLRHRRFEITVSDQGEIGPRYTQGQAEGPAAPPYHLLTFIQNRIKSVRAQLDGKSEGIQVSRNFGGN